MLSYLLAALESEEDKRRFTELYEENHVRAEQTALRILRDPHDAEDAVQNAFLQVIHHFDEISEIPCKKLGFWIISIVKNEALMILRRKQKELQQEDWDTFSADVSDPTSYNELVQLFSQLPPTIYLSEASATLHEFGHFLDWMLGFPAEHEQLFRAEAAAAPLRDYAKTNAREYFADCFAYCIIHGNDSEMMKSLRKNAPQTCTYFEELGKDSWSRRIRSK